jgi:hypothetical protein
MPGTHAIEMCDLFANAAAWDDLRLTESDLIDERLELLE